MTMGLRLCVLLLSVAAPTIGCVSNPTPHPAADAGANASPDPDDTDLMEGGADTTDSGSGCDDSDAVDAGGDACGDGDTSSDDVNDIGPDGTDDGAAQ